MPPSNRQVRSPSSEKAFLDACLHSDHDRPVYMAIRARFIDRFAQYYVLATNTVSESVGKQALVHLDMLSKAASEIARLDKECTKLCSFLFPTGESPLVFRARQWESQMGERDFREPDVVKSLRRNLRRWNQGKGRPAILQPVGIRALELRLKDRRHWSWNALPKELCRCGSEKHGFQCRENIRREVYLLRRALEQLGVKLPAAK